MATTGHCAYCFEVLAADLENRKALPYRQVQDLWQQYQALGKPQADEEEEEEADFRVTQESDMASDVDGTEEDDDDGEEDGLEEPESAGTQEQQSTPSTLQLPSISRLRAPSPGTPSSASSTPSSLSTTSSQRALGDGSSSKSSSASSFFSFYRSKQPSPPAPPKEEEHPLFITWNTISSRGHKSLRGCIGTFDPQQLSLGLKSYALTAAFDDTRFPPISPSELPSLTCSTTLLTHFTSALHPLDWTLGQHGIRISFTHHGKRHGATYLPDVAVEQGWSKDETLDSLVKKAGVKMGGGGGGRGGGGKWRDIKGGVDVVRYEGKKATVGWEEWRAWRRWVEELGGR